MTQPRVLALALTERIPWSALWLAYQAFYKVDLGPVVMDTTWGRLHDAREPIHGALAHLDGEPAGLAHWIMHRSCWTTVDSCYLQDLYVAPSARGQGIGRLLIDHVTAVAAATGAGRIYWMTHETNTDAMVLYDKVGQRTGFVQYAKPTV